MKSIKRYIFESSLPKTLELYKNIKMEDTSDEDYEKIYNILMDIKSPKAWDKIKIMLKWIHDKDEKIIKSIGEHFWDENSKPFPGRAEINTITNVLDKKPDFIEDGIHSDFGKILNFVFAHFLQKLDGSWIQKEKPSGYIVVDPEQFYYKLIYNKVFK